MKNYKTSLIVFLFLVVCQIAVSGQKPNFDLNSKLPMNPAVLTGKLDNGMTYYILHNEQPKNRAELTLVVNAGSVDEDDDQQGFAHFNEHMAFNGTKNFPKNELVNYLESIGMKFGADVNAYTSFDETVFGIQIPLDSVKFLDKGLEILADWSHNVSFDKEEVDKERGVIQEEWRMGKGADDRMMRKNFPVILYNSKYASRIPIGLIDLINNGPADAIQRFYRDWYRPDLMAVVVVGDFDSRAMEVKIKDVFSKIPKAVNPREKKIFEIPDHDNTLVSITTDKEAQSSIVEIFYKHSQQLQTTVRDYRQKLIESLYSMILNNRLNELTMKENPPFIMGISTNTSFIGPKDVYINIAVARNNDFETALKTIMVENERVKRYGFTATEVERMKTAMLRTMETMYNDRKKQQSSQLLQELVRNFTISHEPAPGIEVENEYYKKFIPEITTEEVSKLAKEWITDKNRVFVIQAPEKPDVKIPTEADINRIIDQVSKEKIDPYIDKVVTKSLIDKEPIAGKVDKKTKNKKLDFEEWTLKNGIKVVLKQTDFKNDEILMSAYSFGGTSQYSLKDYISARVTSDVITESGVGPFEKVDLEKYLSDKIVHVDPYISETSEGFDGSSSPRDFETMLQLIYEYFTQPRQDTAAFNSYITKEKSSLQNRNTSPEAAFRDSITAITSQHSPYRKPMTEKLLDEAKLKRVMYIYRDRFGDPSNFTFFFVGNVDKKTAKPLIEKYLGGLPTVNRTETFKDLNIRKPGGIVKQTLYKGSEPKSMVYLNFHGSFNNTMEERTDLKMICEILSTKLLESIREDKSGVYTIGAYPDFAKYPVPTYDVHIVFPCAPENVDKLVAGVMDEVNKLRSKGPSAVDLNKGIEKLQREHETNIRENNFWLSSLKNYYFNNEDLGNILKYDKYVSSASSDRMKAAAGKFFDINNYILVTLKPETTKP
ncbi:MAG: insulinase family protein [Bacteroidia bacterium]|nr:insulinase family protein [Bacteroidia bacterium]